MKGFIFSTQKLAALALFLLFSVATAFTLDDGSASVVRLPNNFHDLTLHGNRHYVFRVTNHTAETREFALNLMFTNVGLSARRTAKIPAGESVIMHLQLPNLSEKHRYYYRHVRLELEIDGHGYNLETLAADLRGDFASSGSYPMALCSTSVPSEDFEAIYSGHAGSSNGLYNFIRSPLGIEEWGREAEDYMNYSIIWVTAEEIIPPDVEKALRKWVFHGGKLVKCVMGPWPSSLKANFPSNAPEPYCHEERYGYGAIFTFKPYRSARTNDVSDYARKVRDAGGSSFHGGTKVALRLPSCVYMPAHLSQIIMPKRDFELDLVSLSNRKGYSEISLEGTPYEPFAISAPRVPIGFLVIVMSIFVLLVGPVNYIVLLKRRLTALMVVSVPIVSFVFCLLVFLFVAFSSGFALRGKIYGLTYLDQKEKLASTRAIVSLLSPNMNRHDLVFDANDNVMFCQMNGLTVLDKPGMQIDSGVVPVRTPLNYTVQRCESTNERARVVKTDGGYEFVNGLSAPLLCVLYRAADGKLYKAVDVKEGKRVALSELADLADTKLSKGNTPIDIVKAFEGILSNIAKDENDKAAAFRKFMPPSLPCKSFAALSPKPMFYKPGVVPPKAELSHIVCGQVEAEAKDSAEK